MDRQNNNLQNTPIRKATKELTGQQLQNQKINEIIDYAQQIQTLLDEIDCLTFVSPIKNKQLSQENIDQSLVIRYENQDSLQSSRGMTNASRNSNLPRYMQPKGNLKEKCLKELIKIQLTKKAELMEMEQMRKSKTTLREFYKTHEPLSEKAQKAKTKKKQMIALLNYQKQLKSLENTTFQPVINKQKYKMPDFEIRLQLNQKKSDQIKKRILQQALKKETFRPKINADYQKQIFLKQKVSKNHSVGQQNESRTNQSWIKDTDWIQVRDFTDVEFLLK